MKYKPKKKILVPVRFKPDTIEKLDKIALDKDETRSELIRKFVENVVNNY